MIDDAPNFDLDLIADLDTPVGLAGTVGQAEVGGNVCFNIVVGIAIYSKPGFTG